MRKASARSSHTVFRKRQLCLAISSLLCAPLALAAPTGAQVTAGQAVVGQAGSVTTVDQSSQKASINWQGFSVGAGETVNFRQPNASAITLNRVVGNEKSVIDGALSANGKVFLINSNGLLFNQGSSVNTAGFVASTLNLSDANFLAGKFVFQGSGAAGSVVNQGRLTASDGGFVALLGGSVSNQGAIVASKGTVALGAGQRITLNFSGDALVSLSVDQGVLDALVENRDAIQADGGLVILSAKAASGLLSAQVNNTGVVRAQTVGELKGRIVAQADGGTASIGGTLDASAPAGGDGGSIETTGHDVRIADSATLTTASASGAAGHWRIAADDLAVGVDGNLTGAALSRALANGNVEVDSTAGDLTVNEAVSWSANTLGLGAPHNLKINSVMSASGSAGLAVSHGSGNDADGVPYGIVTAQGSNADFTGRIDFSGSGKLTIDGIEYTVIADMAGLEAVKTALDGHYVLGADISANSWTTPIGSGSDAFSGSFDGLGHAVTGLWVQTATSLFGTVAAGATVRNVALPFVFSGNWDGGVPDDPSQTAAGLLANVNRGSIVNSFTDGYLLVNAEAVGGLVGVNSGLIAQSYSQSTIKIFGAYGGGLVGRNEAGGRIVDSSARQASNNQNIAGGSDSISYVGGLVGVNAGSIERAYATEQFYIAGNGGSDSNAVVGGLVGLNEASGVIDSAYVSHGTSDVNGSFGGHLSGFVGDNAGTISNAYYGAAMSDYSNWLAGFAWRNSGSISNAYAVVGTPATSLTRYGFVAENTGTLSNVYWSGAAAEGSPAVIGTEGASWLDASAATRLASYAGFDSSVWAASAAGYPLLRQFAVTVASASDVEYGSDAASVLGSLTLRGAQWGDTGASLTLDSSANADAGQHAAASWLSSASYDNLGGSFRIVPRTVTVTGAVSDKTYDGTTAGVLSGGGSIVGLVGSETLGLDLISATYADKNAGSGKDVTLAFTVTDGSNGGKASNYAVSTHATAGIDRLAVSATFSASDKTYDGNADASVTARLPGAAAGDSVTLGWTSAQFADKNAGQNKTVTLAGLSLSGSDAANYELQSSELHTTASIAARAVDLYGVKPADGTTTIDGTSLYVRNAVPGEVVTLGGTASYAAAGTGVQAITGTGGLTLADANYTLAGASGHVVVGSAGLALERVASGSATMSVAGSTTTVTQTSDKAVIDWLRLSIASGETLNFVQPSATSIVLNRVTGNERSVIEGALNANGRVFILNSNGVLFAAGSSVNVAGLVASTGQISDDDFLAGRYVFASSGANSVISEGDIVIVDGGFVALQAAGGVTQTGSVTAHGGKAVLASAGSLALTLDDADVGLAGYTLSGLTGSTGVGGRVDVASAGGGLLEVAGSSVALADNLALDTGSAGTLSLSLPSVDIGAGGNVGAGFVTDNLALRNLAINAADGKLAVDAPLAWSADTRLTLGAATDIDLNQPINASGNAAGLALTYGAGGDYHVNAPVTLSGAGASLNINGADYVLVHDMAQFAALDDSGVANGHFALAQDLDAAGTTYTGAVVDTLTGTLAGLGHAVSNLTIDPTYVYASNIGLIGTAAGSPDAITTLRDIGVVNASIVDGYSEVGALAGRANFAVISHAWSSGTVAGGSAVGGLVGVTFRSNIVDSYSDAAVNGSPRQTGYSEIGGLVGSITKTDVLRSHATGDVTVIPQPSTDGTTSIPTNIGGLIGRMTDGSIIDSWASGNVTASKASVYVGGLVGAASASVSATSPLTIRDSHASGKVVGGTQVGGLIGAVSTYETGSVVIGNVWASGDVTAHYDGGGSGGYAGGLIGTVTNTFGSPETTSITIDNVRASGNVSFDGDYGSYIGGLIGNLGFGTLSNATATGNVTGSKYDGGVGGLVGQNSGHIINGLATGDVSGANSVGTLVGSNLGPGNIEHSESRGKYKSGDGSDPKSVGSNYGKVGADVTYHDAAAEAAARAAEEAARAAEEARLAAEEAAAQAAAEAAAAAAAEAAARAAQEAAARAAQEAAALAAQQAADRAAAAEAAARAATEAAAAARLQQRSAAAASEGSRASAAVQRETRQPQPATDAGQSARPAPVDASISYGRNFSARTKRVEVNGQVFEIDAEDEDDKPKR
ncbi:two-partner secretion domain-containing protein [Derxia lacustris]|uniref:two-partner secretion domain-containing protein n=1 Tax=Derxia lacustris TaxID=764842 RepID=UPI000A172EFB|nr:filamentous hemagglutinin N-terminal domain-containing protein [Derxia lacustris]